MTIVDVLYRYLLLPPIKAITRNDAEVAHNWFVFAMKQATAHVDLMPGGAIDEPVLGQTLLDGIEFPNPFGAAAGMDKNGTIYPALAKLTGVGHIELGGVTRRPQPGNDRPRLVRVDADNLINAMGFPNRGVDDMMRNLFALPIPSIPISMQITLNKTTSPEHAPAEYGELVRRSQCESNGRILPDYFTVNASSPNTPGLRALQAPEFMTLILDEVMKALDEQHRSHRRVLIKLAPDIDDGLVDAIIELVIKYDAGGIVLTNTTTHRPVSSKHDHRPGGFSGSALFARSSHLVKYAAGRLPADRVLVACGGIDTVDRAYEMLHYADLIDGYTGLVLKSPFLFRTIAKGVTARMERDGVQTLAELRTGNRPA